MTQDGRAHGGLRLRLFEAVAPEWLGACTTAESPGERGQFLRGFCFQSLKLEALWIRGSILLSMSAEQKALFNRAAEGALRSWDVARAAVDQGWAGQESAEIIDWMVETVIKYFWDEIAGILRGVRQSQLTRGGSALFNTNFPFLPREQGS